jgi:NAD(P)-dependent dehydrogenase (short-subunit alcohol dehydrogenase family)
MADISFPSFDLSGKMALVTGGSRGIGYTVALSLANAGADVAVTSRKLEDVQKTAEDIAALGRRSLPLALDVQDVESIQKTVGLVLEKFGRIDILVNNAGLNIQQMAVDVTEEAWDTVLDTNLKGAFFCSQAVGKAMIERRQGKIINIASTMATVGLRLRSAYCSSKGGVAQMTKVLAVEWAKYNVNVNAVGPTFLLTPMTKPMLENEEFRTDVMSRIPMGRLATPEDVAGAVVYLASPAADFVTGITLFVDGGWTAW